MAMERQGTGELLCSVTLEKLAASGEVSKRSLHRNVTIILGRNEFREMLLKVHLTKLKVISVLLKELQIHKKFAKDGKATIKIPTQNMQFLLSNCPPDKLIMFLKTLTTKHTLFQMKGFVSDRKKLLSDKPRSFDYISPLNMQELQSVHNARAKAEEKKPDIFTPKGKALKRKRPLDETNKENIEPQNKKLVSKIVSNPVILNSDQKKVLEAVLSGNSIFFTGSAGTGKSFLLRRIIGSLPPQHTFATASTGVAACHIGGTTLHSFAGIGSGGAAIEQCIELAARPQIAQQWKKCKHLIIDEISMVDGNYFSKLEIVARVLKKSNAPFGGIQLILCGDFLQLPPVTKGKEKKRFAFQTKAWSNCIHTNMELTEVRRQDDPVFINILQNIRVGSCPSDVNDALSKTASHSIDRDGILATRLCTHKEDVDQLNVYHLKKIKNNSQNFEGSDSDPDLQTLIDALCPVKKQLELKKGAQVMLCKNLRVEEGLVNGARGVVTGFENTPQGYPMVKFICGAEVTLRPERWTFKTAGGMYLTRRQLPLKLAWAISIHKSQGMTLDCVEISLAKVFECGQAYVALSRAKNLEGLRVLDFHRGCVRADSEVLKFYRSLRGAQAHRQEIDYSSQDVW